MSRLRRNSASQQQHQQQQHQQQQQQQQLISYVPGMDVGGTLEEWPFDNPQSNYVIHAGRPKASGRIDHSTPTTRTGIWRCTVGTMECTEQGDELMTILSGKVEVTDVETGKIVLLQPGDSMFSFHGKRLVWNVLQDVTKVFTVPNPMDIPDI